MLVLAHVSHHLWVLYLPPIAIVLAAIVRSVIAERRRRRRGEIPGG